MVPDPSPSRKLRLGELLVRAGLLTSADLESALADQRQWGGHLGKLLVDLGFVTESVITRALAHQLGLAAVDLSDGSLPAGATGLLPVHLCEQFGVMPLGLVDGTLRIATSDPTDQEALREVALHTGLKPSPVVAGATDIERAIRRHYYGEGAEAAPSPTGSGEAGPDAPRAGEPPSGPAAGEPLAVDSLPERIQKLENLTAKQSRALHALIELLGESGTLDPDAFLERIAGPRR